MTDKNWVESEEMFARDRQKPEIRREYERLALANAVSLEIVRYRAKHHLSQTALAKRLGMNQSAIARLEAAEHNPSFETLCRLSSTLGIEFLVDIAPSGKRWRWVNKNAKQSGETISVDGIQVLIVAAS
jgi:transcriptional regulator with XRE-family HTH domain